jgi:hypothetical protein
MKRPIITSITVILIGLGTIHAIAGEKQQKKEDDKKKPDPVILFDKAIEWQGKPKKPPGDLITLEVDCLDFKIWGKNEVEGHLSIKHTAPNKVWFKVWSPSIWRNYWTNGEAYFKKTGATKAGCEVLSPKVEDDKETIQLIKESARIARLLYLRHHKASDAEFEYVGKSIPGGKKGAPLCHLVRRQYGKSAPKEVMYFYLSTEDYHPVCIAVYALLNAKGVFLVHLDEFKEFNGVRFPTRIETYAKEEDGKFKKFLFANIVINMEEGIKVRVNRWIDDEIYEYQKKEPR